MIEIGTTCAYRFFQGNNCIIAIHHQSKKAVKHEIKSFKRMVLIGNDNDAIYTNLVKKYIGPSWERAFRWGGWAKKRLASSLDYREIAMVFNVDSFVSDSYESPAIAKYKITNYVLSGNIPEMTDYDWLARIKYPVTVFQKPDRLTIEVTNLYHYRAAIAIKGLSYYDYEEEYEWLVAAQGDVKFKNRDHVYRWIDHLARARRWRTTLGDYRDVNSFPNNEIPF